MVKKYIKHQREEMFRNKEPYNTFDKVRKEINAGEKRFITQRVKEEGKTYMEVGVEAKRTWQRIGQIVVEVTKKIKNRVKK